MFCSGIKTSAEDIAMALIDYKETGENDEWLEELQDAIHVTNLVSYLVTDVRLWLAENSDALACDSVQPCM